MHAIKRQRNTSAKALTALSIILVLAVFRHISRADSFVSTDDKDSSSQELGGRRSLFFRPSHHIPVKRCISRVRTLPPTLPTEEGAVGDIKRITADWEHISAYVQSCDFQSKQNISNAVSKTRGIVIPSAGHAMFAHTWVVVTILRETLGCSLPIEIVFNGKEELDFDLAEQLKMMSDVTLVDASLITLPLHHRPMNWTQVFGQAKYVHATGYSFKAYVLAFVTKFDEVLVLDSDNLPLQNPEALFESPQYLKKGSSFWPDWWQRSRTQQIPFFLDVDPFAYNTFGLQAPWEVSDHPMTATESGTMMLDRRRHADVMEFIWLLNSHPEVTFAWMHGDKDTYRLAFHLANKSSDFAQVPTPPGQALDAHPGNMPFYRHTGMVQHDWNGVMAFLHRTSTAKFNPDQQKWRHVDYVTSPLTHRQAELVVNNGDGWQLGQLNMEFEKYCCGLTDFEAHKLAAVREEFLQSQTGCSIHECDIPQTGDGLPVMAFPPEIAFALTNATEVIHQMDKLYAVMQQAKRRR